MSDIRIPYRAWYILMDSGTNVWTKKMPKTLVFEHFGTLWYSSYAEREGFEPNAPICSISVIYKNSFR